MQWPSTRDEIDVLSARMTDRSAPGIPHAVSGSPLHDLDDATDPHFSSWAFSQHFMAGLDCLVAIRLLTGGPVGTENLGSLLPASPHLLFRGSLEAFSTAMWLVAPDDHLERVRRGFRLAVQNLDDQYKTLHQVPRFAYLVTNYESDREALLQQAELALGSPLSANQQRVRTEQVIRHAVEQVSGPIAATESVLEWQAASGIAHGRRWARDLLLTHVEGTRQLQLWQVADFCNELLNLAGAAEARYLQLNATTET